MISPETIEEIKDKSDIVQIISEYVSLKKRGKNYLGLCPFHPEKTASFTVSPDKKIFHCFGCNEGGNIFSFIMKAESLDFLDAVEFLASRANIFVKRSGEARSDAQKSLKNKLISIMEMAIKFYEDNLAQNPEAKKYLEKRGLKEETIKKFRLGYSPDSWDALFKHLAQKGVSPSDIEKAGLILARQEKEGFYDRFRDRIMFPIFDIQSKPIAFGARTMKDSEVKYINSPDSPIYNKGDILYGLNFAKDFSKKEGFMILCEGYMDALACFQARAFNSAAVLGTALTANQAKIIRRFAETAVLVFDNDTAGNAATFRSVEILRNAGISVKTADLGKSKDPDEFIRANGERAFAEKIISAKSYLEYKFDHLLLRYNISEVEGRAKAIKEAASLLARETDRVAQAEYAKLAALKLKCDIETLTGEIQRLSFYERRANSPSRELRRVTEKPASKIDLAEQSIIRAALESEEALKDIRQELSAADFTAGATKEIAEMLFNTDFEKHAKIASFLMDNLPSDEAKKTLSRVLVEEALVLGVGALKDYINTLKSEKLKKELLEIKNKLAEAEKKGQESEILMLSKEFGQRHEALRQAENRV